MMKEKNIIEKLFFLLLNRHKKYYFYCIILLFIASILQVIGIGSLIPLTSAFFNNGSESDIINFLKDAFELQNNVSNFKIILIFTTSIIIFSNIIFLISTYASTKINFLIEQNIREDLFKFYINGNFSNFFKTNKNLLMNLIIFETQRFSGQVLMPLADIISRIVILFFLVLFLFFIVPFKAILSIGCLIIFYVFLFHLFKKKINKNNMLLSIKNENLFKVINDIFSSFREIKIYGLENKFLKQVFESTRQIQKIKFFSTYISVSPRFILEILIFFIIFIYFITVGNQYDEKYLGLLTVLGYSLFKILPTVQGIFTQLVVYNSNKNSVSEIYSKLQGFKKTNIKPQERNLFFDKKDKINNIKLLNISFSFNSKKIFQDLDLEILKGEKIGIIGPTGIGKSTLINILLGILKPQNGKIYINDKDISHETLLEEMKNFVAIIPQVASILEDTILNNIILGDYYDKEIFNKILDKSLVSNFVDSKNLTINDKIHGTGQNLSGGQIQRILIARALYRQPKILIIDEGFNQLDNETENKILDSIFEIKDLIIVVIYHNFLKKDMLDKIYTIKDLKLSKIKL